ncbi:MAG: VCBS repeat-containing protein [Phycisphaerales bacterium]|nr:VCBS repeat-containing protein [Phycisphaerales bacterium]
MVRLVCFAALGAAVLPASASDVPFEPERALSTTTDSARAVVCGDIDRDGDLDIVVASAADSFVRVFRNNNGTIPSFTAQTAATSINTPVCVSLADIDGDGDPDTGLIFVTCPADLSGSSDPGDPAYGVSDGGADSSDFFFFLDQFEGGNALIADYTSTSDPQAPGYGVPDGIVDASDFFFYLDLFALGCD